MAWHNIATLLKPKGILVYIDVLGETKYYVGDAIFSTLPIEMPFVRQSLENAGFEITKCEEEKYSSEDGKLLTDSDRFVCIIAKRIA